MMVSISILSNNFSSMHIVAKPFDLSCDIVDLRWFFNNFNFEKLLSTDDTVKGRVNKISNINIRIAIGCSNILKNFHTSH
jgi:hypothetical protein